MLHVPHWLEHPTSSVNGRTAARHLAPLQGARQVSPLLAVDSEEHPRTVKETNWGFLPVPRVPNTEGAPSPAIWAYSAGVQRSKGGRDDAFVREHQRGVLDATVGQLRAEGELAKASGHDEVARWYFRTAEDIYTFNHKIDISVEQRWIQISAVGASRFKDAKRADSHADSFASAVANELLDELKALPNSPEWQRTFAQNDPLIRRAVEQLGDADPAHRTLEDLRQRPHMRYTPVPRSTSAFSLESTEPGDLQVIVKDPTAPLRYINHSIGLEPLLNELATRAQAWAELYNAHGPQSTNQNHWFDPVAMVTEARNRLSPDKQTNRIDSDALHGFIDEYNNAALSLLSLLPENERGSLVNAILDTYYRDPQADLHRSMQPLTAQAITALNLDLQPNPEAFFIRQLDGQPENVARTAQDMQPGPSRQSPSSLRPG